MNFAIKNFVIMYKLCNCKIFADQLYNYEHCDYKLRNDQLCDEELVLTNFVFAYFVMTNFILTKL